MSGARAAIGVILALAVVLFAATVHQMREGGRAIAESDAAMARGDLTTAIARARAAAEATAPGSPYPARAYDRLFAVAREAEAHGDEAIALAAWSAMRAAAIETGSALGSNDRFRRAADEGIARVGSGARASTDGRASAEVRASEPALREALARDDPPQAARLLLLAAAAVTFFAGALRLAWIGADLAALKRARFAASAALVGLALYTVVCAQG